MTLIYSAQDTAHNNAVALQAYLEAKLRLGRHPNSPCDRYRPSDWISRYGCFDGASPIDRWDGSTYRRLQSVRMRRWGDPGGGAFRLEDFGGVMEAEQTFGNYTIPNRVRVGSYVGSPRFDTDGEFFRATIDDATYH